MKLQELLENIREWKKQRNFINKLPELKCGAFTVTCERGSYVIDVGSFEHPHQLGNFATITELNKFLTHNYEYPPITEELAEWLKDDEYLCIRISNSPKRYGILMITMRNIVRTVRDFDDLESKDELLKEIQRYVKQFLVNNYSDVDERYGWEDKIQLDPITIKMIEEFTATGKYKAGDY